MLKSSAETTSDFAISFITMAQPMPRPQKSRQNGETKRILFFKNEPEKLLKTNDRPEKRTGNEPKTNRAKSLKTNNGSKNEPKTNRKTKRAMFLKIKGRQKRLRNQSPAKSGSHLDQVDPEERMGKAREFSHNVGY